MDKWILMSDEYKDYFFNPKKFQNCNLISLNRSDMQAQVK